MAADRTAASVFPSRRKLAQAQTILRGDGSDQSDRDTLRSLWRLLLPDECGQDGSPDAREPESTRDDANS